MPNRHFEKSVAVDAERTGQPRIISDTLQAAEILLRRWPGDRHQADYIAAIQACLDAFEGNATGGDAQRAFTRAARRARILAATGRAR